MNTLLSSTRVDIDYAKMCNLYLCWFFVCIHIDDVVNHVNKLTQIEKVVGCHINLNIGFKELVQMKKT
jgi:hypothetical protein